MITIALIGTTLAVSYALSNDISIIKLTFANDDNNKKAATEKGAEKASCEKGEKKSGCCSQKGFPHTWKAFL